MKLKVMHLTGHLKTGGAENLITDYALNFNKKNIDVIVVTLGRTQKSFNERKLEENGIKIMNLGDRYVFSNANNFFKVAVNKIYRYFSFLKYVNKEKPNIIHSHLLVVKYLIPVNSKKLRIKFFYTVHSEVGRLFRKERILFRFYTRYCIKIKGMVPIALHSRMQKEVNELFKTDKCIVLNNAVDINRFNSSNFDRNSIRESLGLKNDTFVVGHVGRFVEAKNHKFLIEVFKDVKEKCIKAHLLLIGTGELEDKIKKQVKELGLDMSVTFLGNRSDIPELMSAMDTFVFPSLREGFGNVLIEAQAIGLKCVVSSRVPNDAFITKLVNPLGLNEPKEKWSTLILEKNTPKVINSSLESYDINNVINKLEELYRA
ncbi:glycosyltransferase [Sutcliffiella horikoshii]|uniref:glycosyltransferase n=1 Tax=Sutcliffiella horikoshii TaxID=79883 RepID=UPI00384B4E5F